MASHNIAQNLRDNNTNWQNVKQAIEDMGVSTSGLTTADYDDAIRAIETGSEPVLDSVNITPSTVSQQITPPVGTDGYDEINVAAVDNTIDANIVAGNIKDGVQILGVTGNYSGQSANYQSKTVTPAATEQIVAPDQGYDALSQVTVNGDADLVAGNIKKDVEIFGVVGTYESGTVNLETRTVDGQVSTELAPTPVTYTPAAGYDGFSEFSVRPARLENTWYVTPSANEHTKDYGSGGIYKGAKKIVTHGDANLVAGNIKSGVTIFGVQGTLAPNLQTKSVTPTTSAQQITPDSGYDGLSEVDVAAVTAAIDANITAGNIKKDVQILGVTGTFEGDTSVKVAISESKAYSDSSPVTYEWTLDSVVDTINITNANEGGGTWNQPTANNLEVSIKSSASGSYQVLTEGTDYTLTVTGSGSGNYYYDIEIPCDDYIYAVKVVYTNIYRVRGRLDTNKIINVKYDVVAPSSTTGFNEGDLWFVMDAENVVTNQYKFNGTAWVEEEIGAEIYKTSINFLQEPANQRGDILVEYNGDFYILSTRDFYKYDEANNQFVSVHTESSDIIGNDAINTYKSVMLGKNLYIAGVNMSGFLYINVIDFETYTKSNWIYQPTGIGNGVKSMCSDGENLYLADGNNLKIWGINIDTQAITAIATIPTVFTSMVYRDGFIYAVRGDYVYKVDISDGTVTLLFNTSSTTDEDTYRTLVADSDYIYLIGGKNSLKKILKFNDSNYISYDMSSEYRECKALIYKGELYALNLTAYHSNDRMIRKLGTRLNKNTFISGSQLGTEISTKVIKKVTVVS